MLALVLTTSIGSAEFPLLAASSGPSVASSAIGALNPTVRVRVGTYLVQPRDFILGLTALIIGARFFLRR